MRTTIRNAFNLFFPNGSALTDRILMTRISFGFNNYLISASSLLLLLLCCGAQIILKIRRGEKKKVFNRFNRLLQSTGRTFLSDDVGSMDFSLVSYYDIQRFIEFN